MSICLHFQTLICRRVLAQQSPELPCIVIGLAFSHVKLQPGEDFIAAMRSTSFGLAMTDEGKWGAYLFLDVI